MSETDTRFELSDGEKAHPLWRRLHAHFADQLDQLRRRNDDLRTEAETAALRGHIRCLKVIMDLGKDRPLTGD